MNVYLVQNSVLWLSKGLISDVCSIKEFTFAPSIECRSFKLTAELHLTRNVFYWFEKIWNLSKICILKYRRLFLFPTRFLKLVKNSHKISLFLQLFIHFQSWKLCVIRFSTRLPMICFEKRIYLELCSQVYIKIKILDYLHRNQPLLFGWIKKFNWLGKKTCTQAICFNLL